MFPIKKTLMVCIVIVLTIASLATTALANEVFQTKPYLVDDKAISVVPIETMRNKITLFAKVNGTSFRFILDTGSPTVLSQHVASALKLAPKGQNIGQDAHGNQVKMDLSILDSLLIGKSEFRNIPIFIHDFSKLPLGRCVIDGGVIGSEIMPLTQWQINFEDNQLILGGRLDDYKFIKGAKRASMQTYNYPFTPIVEHKINDELKDNAIFDTGNTELLHLNIKAFDELKKRGALNLGSIKNAHGTFGESAGGRGNDTDFQQVALDSLSIGELEFSNLSVWSRPQVPTLIGAKVFESQIVTLDYKNNRIHFYPYQDAQSEDSSFGFRGYFDDDSLKIGFLTDNSVASNSGLELHAQILKINDISFESINESNQCQRFEQFSQLMHGAEISLMFKKGDETHTVSLKQ
ncbi:MAG: aspartyl protease family protein, partial [Pseudomonadota bacterium]